MPKFASVGLIMITGSTTLKRVKKISVAQADRTKNLLEL
jgi:hypothetical protein